MATVTESYIKEIGIQSGDIYTKNSRDYLSGSSFTLMAFIGETSTTIDIGSCVATINYDSGDKTTTTSKTLTVKSVTQYEEWIEDAEGKKIVAVEIATPTYGEDNYMRIKSISLYFINKNGKW
jgi:hypothetical protein